MSPPLTSLAPGYRLSFAPEDADPAAAHAYLTRSYWAKGIPLETVALAMANSLCCTVHDGGGQVGMVRVMTDYATTAYLTDVYVLEEHRGHGLASAMLEAAQAHPRLQGLRRWMLFTTDAQPLYVQAGWNVYPHPDRTMVRDDPNVYL